MQVFLPVAGISVNLLVLVGCGVVVGFLSGLVGVGGGVLLTPMLILLGVRPTVAAASGSNAIVATSSSGMAAHLRLGNVDMRLGTLMLAGSLTGAAIGVEVVKILRALGEASVGITLTYVVVLGGVGGYMFAEGWRSLRRGMMVLEPAAGSEKPSDRRASSRLPWQMDFPRAAVRHSVLVPFALCVFIGVLTAIMGVGGGFLIIPAMIYLLRVPMRVAVGTSLFQILFTCAGVTYLQATANRTVDVDLKLLLAVLALAVMAEMAARLVMLPDNLLSPIVTR